MNHSVSTVPRSKPWGIWSTLLLSLGIIGAFSAIQVVIVMIAGSLQAVQSAKTMTDTWVTTVTYNGFVIAIATVIACPIGIALIAGCARLRRPLSLREYLGLKRPTRRQLVEWCLVMVITSVMLDLVKLLWDLTVVPESVLQLYATAYSLPLFYLAVVIVGPVFEEVLFRGFMFKGIQHSSWGIGGAIALPSLAWALMHQQYAWFDMTWLFVLGLLLGLARLRTGSLYVAIAMHVLNNFLSLVQATWIL